MEYYNVIDNVYISALKKNIIYPCFKVELLSPTEEAIGEVIEDISNTDAGSISINYQQGTRRSCAITLVNRFKQYTPDANKKIWIDTKFKLYTGIKVPISFKNTVLNLNYNNSNDNLLYATQDIVENEILYGNEIQTKEYDIYWFSQGVYILTNPSVLRDMSNKTITLNGVDKFGILGSETNFNELEGTYNIPAGTTVKKVIEDILLLDKGNGEVVDPKKPIIQTEVGMQELPFDINKSPNSYFTDILVELANIFACDIYYDVDGYLHFEKGNESQNFETLPSIWNYSDLTPEYFTPTLDLDFVNVYNVFKVIGNNPATQVFEYIAKNNDLNSPTRIELIGEKIKYIESSFCYTAQRAKDFANYSLRKHSVVQQSLQFQSSFIPHLDVNKVVTIEDEYFFEKGDRQRFFIQSITMPLSCNSLMDIQAANCATIPYFEY